MAADLRHSNARMAVGLLRTILVSATTLAILGVCFWIYELSQQEPLTLSEPATTAQREDRKIDPVKPLDDASAVNIGGALAGAGKKLNISAYAPGESRARLELYVADWEPISGAANEFRLVEPEIRTRTGQGYAIKVVADHGVLEKAGQGGRFEMRRGRLWSGVVIEIDRLTEAERAALPEERRNLIDPADIVRIELDEIEFDLEYDKFNIPGRFRVIARDIQLEAGDMELRFNQKEGRVKYCRMKEGGRLSLQNPNKDLGLSMPTMGAGAQRHSPFVDWLKATIQQQIAKHQADANGANGEQAAADQEALPQRDTKQKVAENVEESEGDPDASIPVFTMDDGEDQAAQPPICYRAVFEDEVDALHEVDGATRSRLRADNLEILRAFTYADQARVQSGMTGTTKEQDDTQPSVPSEHISLVWSGLFVVQTLAVDEDTGLGDAPSRITAQGSPVRLDSTSGEATCATLIFKPGTSDVQLTGTEEIPVVVRSGDQGRMEGLAVFFHREADRLNIRVIGPGTLLREVATSTTPSAKPDKPDKPAEPARISFGDELIVEGRFVNRTRFDLKTGITSGEVRVIDRAHFTGGANLEQGDTRLRADELIVTFGSSGPGDQQNIEHVEGVGNIRLAMGDDRVSCRRIDIDFASNAGGGFDPRTAVAKGNVEAIQGARTIHARDSLIVDFEPVESPAPPFEFRQAYLRAIAAGLEADKIDWNDKRRQHDGSTRSVLGVKRLRAVGEVSIVDPAQGLEVAAERLDCTIVGGTDISTADIRGTTHRPAALRLEAFSLTGQEIHLSVPDETADVPGAGRMTFHSRRDLDGRQLSEPIPIVITWGTRMKYRGKDNRARFEGGVHATSATTTMFDSRQLDIEFEDRITVVADADRRENWWIFSDLADQWRGKSSAVTSRRFLKEPTVIIATGGPADGNAVVQTVELDPTTGEMISRSRIAGPEIFVNLRADVAKMRIEGKGNLLLEDFREDVKQADASSSQDKPVFGLSGGGGPSKTLIRWDDLCSYDFAAAQVRFEGGVKLTHLSGAALGNDFAGTASKTQRATYLNCDTLSADFLDRTQGTPSPAERRMGRLSNSRLRQFHAVGKVTLTDDDARQRLDLSASELIYERVRQILTVRGSGRREANIQIRKRGEFPQEYTARYFIYNLRTNDIDIKGLGAQGR